MLSNKQVKKALDKIGWKAIIEAVEETFIEEAKGNTESPAKIIMHLEGTLNDYRVMPSRMYKYPYCGTKIIAACGDNPKVGLPLARGIYILNENEHQETVMVCRAEELTAYRTAAATAVATKYLAKEDSKILGIIGCGVQAYSHIQAIEAVHNISEILVYDTDVDKQMDMVNAFKNTYAEGKSGVLKYADIVVTLTPTREPHIFKKDIDLHKEQLICAVGGDSDKKIEIHQEVLPFVDHFCDSYLQVAHTGIVHRGFKGGLLTETDLKSLGSFITGKSEIDNSKHVKMLLSTGVALEDLALARLVYEQRK